MTAAAKISLRKLFGESFAYCATKWKEMTFFSVLNALFFAIGFKVFDGWHDRIFVVWLAAYYVFWFAFFRFYFGRKPLIFTKNIFGTLLPSAKIFVLMLTVMTLLLVLPVVFPILFGNSLWLEQYLFELQKYMEESKIVNIVTMAIFTFIFPLIYYRPMMAWIGSVIGRSGVLSTAFLRTKGSYVKFLLLTIIFNSAYLLVEGFDSSCDMRGWLNILLGSPLVILGNVVLAKAYEYFFWEINK